MSNGPLSSEPAITEFPSFAPTEDTPTTIVTTDDSPSAIRLAALEQAVIFASNCFPVSTRTAHQVIQDSKSFESYINGNVS